MKIVLISGQLEPGKGGVGDYTWTLASALKQRGIDAGVLAFSDPFVSVPAQGARLLRGKEITFDRIPASLNPGERNRMIETVLSRSMPDWTSLQFVPYSFDSRGLVGADDFPWHTTSAGRRHVMFHETWIGSHPGAPLKQRMMGWLQRRAVQSAMRAWNPEVIHTSCDVYAAQLGLIGLEPSILPLFATIEKHPAANPEKLLQQFKASSAGWKTVDDRNTRLIGIFGTVHDTVLLQTTLSRLMEGATRDSLKLGVACFNQPQAIVSLVRQTLEKHADQHSILTFAALPDLELSELLQGLDIGISTTPMDVIGKSSAAAVLKEHGMPVIVCSPPHRGGKSTGGFILADEFVEKNLLLHVPELAMKDGLGDAAGILLKSLGAS